MTTEQAKEIAGTIRQQLGPMAYQLLGVKSHSFGTDEGKANLSLVIGKNPKKVTHVKISYNVGQDLYEVKTYCIRGTKTWKELDEKKEIYVENLQDTIEAMTGLYVRF